MQGLLSLEQAPPISAPLRFFLTAPLFGMLAGGLLWYSGPELFASRWTPGALALTHLLTAGFILQAVLGALQQLLPVVAGANIARPRLIAGVVHSSVTAGALLLVAAFLLQRPTLFVSAALLLGIGVGTFIVAAALALHAAPISSPISAGLGLALLALGVTVTVGLLLALALVGSLSLPLPQLINIHLGWGFVGWGCTLIGAVAFVVVPMFQQTPAYPAWFGRGFGLTVTGLVALWTLAELSGWNQAAGLISVGVALMAAVLAITTLNQQRRSKRAKPDATGRLWQLGMSSALTACALWLAALALPSVSQWSDWPLLFGTLVLLGGFTSIIVGMLNKIVPFLVWLHLQHRAQGRLLAPNMKKVLAQRQIDGQALAHLGAFGLLLAAVLWPQWFTYAAGAGLIVSNTWLLCNLLAAMAVYRNHLARLDA